MRFEKKVLVEDISEVLKEASFLYFISYKGLNVKDFSSLRDELAKNDAQCTVFKNSLIKKAAEQAGINDLAELSLAGDTALISGLGDAGAVAKVIADFAKKSEEVRAKAGYVEGTVLDEAGVKSIADLPSKDTLRAMLLGTLEAPARNLVGVLNNAGAQIVNVLGNYKDSKA
jgi:large subunit ribosomal protein L10